MSGAVRTGSEARTSFNSNIQLVKYITIIFPDESRSPVYWHKWHNVIDTEEQLRRVDSYIKWKYPGVKYYNKYAKKQRGQDKGPYLGRRYLNQ